MYRYSLQAGRPVFPPGWGCAPAVDQVLLPAVPRYAAPAIIARPRPAPPGTLPKVGQTLALRQKLQISNNSLLYSVIPYRRTINKSRIIGITRYSSLLTPKISHLVIAVYTFR
jgi:hypothetical protein